jgi:hypothetical protein
MPDANGKPTFWDTVKTALSGAAAGGAQAFSTRTPEGRAIVGDTVKESTMRLLPWLLLGGVIVGMVLNKRK